MQRLLNIESTFISKSHSYLDNITLAKPDVILGLAAAFNADKDPIKVNLSVGAYRSDEGLPYIFDSVRRVESRIFSKPVNHVSIGLDRSTFRLRDYLLLSLGQKDCYSDKTVSFLRVKKQLVVKHFLVQEL